MTISRHRPFSRLLDIRRLFGERRAIDEELAFHIANKTDELIAEGWAPEAAAIEAARRFGDRDRISVECRDIAHRRRRGEDLHALLDTAWQNVRLGLRQIRRSPTTSAAAIVSLVAGIGAATALYSVAHATLIRPLPFTDPDRLVRVLATNSELDDMQASAPDFIDWRAESTAFEDLAAIGYASLALTDREPPRRLDIAPVSASFFEILGHSPRLGRTFTEAEDRPAGDNDVAVLSHGLFTGAFGGDDDILGQVIDLDGRRLTVIGVMDEDFAFPEWADLWIPLAPDPMAQRDDHELDVIGRLASGMKIGGAQAELESIAATIAERHARSNAGWSARLISFEAWLIAPGFRRALFILLAAVGCLVALAAVNVANVLVARSLARGHELAMRAALGAGRGRLVGQLLTEGLLLALLGGAGGLIVAGLVVTLLNRLDPEWIPRVDTVALDGPVLLFALGLTVVTGLLFTILPALHATGRGLGRALAEGGRGQATEGRRLRGVLVAAEVGFATLLLVGGGLLFDSFTRLQRVDTGFETDGVLEVRLQLPGHRYGWGERGEVAAAIEAELARVPGVEAAGFTNVAPFGGFRPVNTLQVVGHETDSLLMSDWRAVSPRYFETLGIPILRGRAFTDADHGDAAPVTIVSRAMADALWPNGDAVGGQIDWGSPGGRPLTVVGIAGNVRDLELTEDRWTLYRPHRQLSWASISYLLRTERPADALGEEIRQAVWRFDPDLPVPSVEPLRGVVSDAMAGSTSTMALLIAFAAIALLLAASGIFGLTLFAVERRQRELGVRLALGASPRGLVAMLLGSGLRLAIAGATVGLGLAILASRYLSTLLYGTRPLEITVYAAVVGVLLAVTALASYLPARRAARLDPTSVLRAS